MRRCIQLAEMGAGRVAPNPMVGAVLVWQDTIIGEGYHQALGQAHAEVNCINSVPANQKQLISESTLYVSLEPCTHFGKTPPCSDFIIHHKIAKIVIACKDLSEKINGKGIHKLQEAGLEVITGVLEKEAINLNRRFFIFHLMQRPYIILKWAQTVDGFIGTKGSRLKISNQFTDRLVHKWRSEEPAIMVGTGTVLNDNPSLTVRLVEGKNPVRIIIDKELKIPASLNVFNEEASTIIFNELKEGVYKNLMYYKIEKDTDVLFQAMKLLYKNGILSVLIEGGAQLLQSFIDLGLWDEARIIINNSLQINEGVAAPVFHSENPYKREEILNDSILYFLNGEHKIEEY